MDIILFFIKNRKFTMILTLMAALMGVKGLRDLNSEAFPNVNLGVVKIVTYYDGASAADIELKITKPIENEIRTVSGLKKVKSISQPGVSSVTTVVDIDNFDADEVVPEIQRALDSVSDLPQDLRSKPSFLEVKSEEFPVIELAITGGETERDRHDIAELLKEELEDNNKISNIFIEGFTKKRFIIDIDPDLLIKNKVSLEQATQAIRVRNRNIPGGFIEKLTKQNLIKVEGKVKNIQELENIVVRANFSGRTIRLSDIAIIREGGEDPTILANHNGLPATLLVITKKAGADLVQLADEIYPLLDRIEKELDGKYSFSIYNDEGKRVRNKVSVLTSNALWGLVLVVFFLIVFLPGRAGIMSAMSLPLAMLATLSYMAFSGMTVNTVTILGLIIALGMLVDNSVVISENYNRLLGEGETSQNAAYLSVKKLWLPITLTALTTIAAFVPMLVTRGIMGQFIKYIPLIITAALLISLAESFFLLPARLFTTKSTKNQKILTKKDWFSKYILPVFESTMSKLIKRRYLGLAIFFVLISGSIYLLVGVNKVNLFPYDQTEVYIGRITLPQGTEIKSTNNALIYIAEQIKRKKW